MADQTVRVVRIRTPAGRCDRTDDLISVATRELSKHRRAIEVDDSITKVRLEFVLGRRSGNPVKVRYEASSETDLTAVKENE